MTYWEMMTEDVRNKLIEEFKPYNTEEFIDDMSFNKDIDGYEPYLDEFGCFIFRDNIIKVQNGKIVNIYYLYEIEATAEFGDNKELLLIVGHERAAVINRNTFEEIVSTYTR